MKKKDLLHLIKLSNRRNLDLRVIDVGIWLHVSRKIDDGHVAPAYFTTCLERFPGITIENVKYSIEKLIAAGIVKSKSTHYTEGEERKTRRVFTHAEPLDTDTLEEFSLVDAVNSASNPTDMASALDRARAYFGNTAVMGWLGISSRTTFYKLLGKPTTKAQPSVVAAPAPPTAVIAEQAPAEAKPVVQTNVSPINEALKAKWMNEMLHSSDDEF